MRPRDEERHPALRSARAVARHSALDALSLRARWTGDVRRGLATPRVHLPYLHAVPPGEEATLRRLLTVLAASHTFISYSEAVDRVLHGPIDRPYVAFSFDDGFASNVRSAAILEEFGATGMFFVPSGFVGTPSVQAARDFYGFSAGVDEPAMTWDDLEGLLDRGHEVGNHTRGHHVVSWADPAAADDDIHRGAEELRTRLGRVHHFAWPRGRFSHFTPRAAQTVRETGHLSCASAERGAHRVPTSKDPASVCLRRDHLMTAWPLRHQLYFLAQSALRSRPTTNDWPESWDVT